MQQAGTGTLLESLIAKRGAREAVDDDRVGRDEMSQKKCLPSWPLFFFEHSARTATAHNLRPCQDGTAAFRSRHHVVPNLMPREYGAGCVDEIQVVHCNLIELLLR